MAPQERTGLAARLWGANPPAMAWDGQDQSDEWTAALLDDTDARVGRRLHDGGGLALDAASNTLLTLQISKMKAQGKEVSDEDAKALLADIKKRYTDAMHPAYGAARLWLDAIIEPEQTRESLIHAIEMSANNPVLPEYKTGVLQT